MFERLQDGELFEVHLSESDKSGVLIRLCNEDELEVTSLIGTDETDTTTFGQVDGMFEFLEAVLLDACGLGVDFEFVCAFDEYTELNEQVTAALRGEAKKSSLDDDDFISLTQLQYRIKVFES